MVQRLKPVDVVTIGVRLTGSLAALELAKEGLKIVGLESGAARFTVPDFQKPHPPFWLGFFIWRPRRGTTEARAPEFTGGSV
jgi:choline dehydrogenase-like flavoprotein